MSADNWGDMVAFSIGSVPGITAPGVHRHDCGQPRITIAEDGVRTVHDDVVRRCGWGNCIEMYCPRCRRSVGGFGIVGCPCTARGLRGHQTVGEQPRRKVAVRRR